MGEQTMRERLRTFRAFGSFKAFGDGRYYYMYVLAAMAAAVFLTAAGAVAPARYRVEANQKSGYDITAPFDMVDEAQTERYAREASAAVPKAYAKNPAKVKEITDKAESFADMLVNEQKVFLDASGASASGGTGAAGSGGASGASGAEAYTQLLLDRSVTRLVDKSDEFGVPISREQAAAILSGVAQNQLATFLNDFKQRVSAYAELEITPDNISGRALALQNAILSTYANQNLKNMAALFAQSALEVNVEEDREKTEERRNEAYAGALERKIVISKGDRILSVDDRVSQDTMALLQSYGMIETGKPNARQMLRLAIVVGCATVLLALYAARFFGRPGAPRGHVVLLAFLIVFGLFICRLIYPLGKLAAPVYIAPILIAYLLGLHAALAAHMYIIVVMAMFSGMDVATLLIYMIGGILAATLTYSAAQRSRLTWAALVLSVVNAGLFVVFANDIMAPATYYADAAILFSMSLASALLSMGLIALGESAFNTATPLRLTELSSGNTPLLMRLSFEAPGTHHHSLMVSYMSEQAAHEIGANAYVAKAGALYHDVGKLNNPEFFTENQSGVNPHDELPPEKSASIIISHTGEGLELCARAKLPKAVMDIVKEHHGDTPVMYFYKKAQKLYGEENALLEDYRYPGPRPTSRESAIVMLADSCEAAIRSSGMRDEQEIDGWVEKIVKQKLDDGQLENSEITIRDLREIKKSFTRVLLGYYHTRVRYPDDQRQMAAQQAARALAAGHGAGGGAGDGAAALPDKQRAGAME